MNEGVSLQWFSAMVKLVIVVDGEASTYVRSTFVFRAPDWDSARARAVELGRASETTYSNLDEKPVSWHLVEVETLDLLGEELADGREVYSEFVTVGDEFVGTVFRPEESRPTQSGV